MSVATKPGKDYNITDSLLSINLTSVYLQCNLNYSQAHHLLQFYREFSSEKSCRILFY